MSQPHAMLDVYVVGARCWFPDKDAGWISGEVTNKRVEGDQVTLSFKDEKDKVSLVRTGLAPVCRSAAATAPTSTRLLSRCRGTGRGRAQGRDNDDDDDDARIAFATNTPDLSPLAGLEVFE